MSTAFRKLFETIPFSISVADHESCLWQCLSYSYSEREKTFDNRRRFYSCRVAHSTMYHKIKIFSRAHDTSVGRRKHTINRETHRQSYQKFYFATLHQLSTLDHLVMPCYCSYSPKSFLSLRPKPHLQMYSGIGPLSPTTQGCSTADCKVIRSPGSA